MLFAWVVLSVTAANTSLQAGVTAFEQGDLTHARRQLNDALAQRQTLQKGDYARALLYLAACEQALDDSESATLHLVELARFAPDFTADPRTFLPEFILLAKRVRAREKAHREEKLLRTAATAPPPPTPAPPSVQQASTSAPGPSQPHTLVYAGWASGTALVGAGVVCYLEASARHRALSTGSHTLGDANRLVQEGSTLQSIGFVAGGVGLAAAATATLAHLWPRAAATPVSVNVTPELGGGGRVSAAVHF